MTKPQPSGSKAYRFFHSIKHRNKSTYIKINPEKGTK